MKPCQKLRGSTWSPAGPAGGGIRVTAWLPLPTVSSRAVANSIAVPEEPEAAKQVSAANFSLTDAAPEPSLEAVRDSLSSRPSSTRVRNSSTMALYSSVIAT
eukprot:Nk52_evm1s1793 gene=Nk52_evmTU1s1793